MANRYTAFPIPAREEIESLYNVGKTQAEVGEHFGVSQKVVYKWFQKLSIKSRVPVKRNQLGPNNDSWKGGNATYAAFHKRVEATRGKPMICSACGTQEAKRFEWCNLTGKYEDVNDYLRMCVSCHRKYDKNRKGSSKHVRRTAK